MIIVVVYLLCFWFMIVMRRLLCVFVCFLCAYVCGGEGQGQLAGVSTKTGGVCLWAVPGETGLMPPYQIAWGKFCECVCL